jgi:hypothetical protein
MKNVKNYFAIAILFIATTTNGQINLPAGFTKATIVLYGGSALSGYVKENIKKSASIVFFNDSQNKKTTYDGNQISSIKINDDNYICVSGDFFKVISTGKITFVQKQSDASNKPSYNGNEPVFNNGTEGSIGDYFVYRNSKLNIINRKTIEAFINKDLADDIVATEKAKNLNGDVTKLKDAIDIYNKSTK